MTIFRLALLFFIFFDAPSASAEDCSVLLSEGKNLYEINAERFEKNYYHTSGFQTLSEFQKTIRASRVKDLIQIAEKLRLQQVTPAMFRSPSKREKILKNGFKSIHETRTSSMDVFDHDYPYEVCRRFSEASMLDLSSKEYSAVSPCFRPKSGLLIDQIQDLKSQWLNNQVYGSDAWLFDVKKVGDQMTFTPGDSLNRAIKAAEDPNLSEFQKGKRNTDDFVGGWALKRGEKLFKFLSWDLHYIPWSHREMLAPITYFRKKQKLFLFNGDQQYDGSDAIKNTLNQKQKNIPESLSVGLASTRASYIEVQFWKNLHVSQVNGFVFFEQEPSIKFYQQLTRLGIQIYDGRKNSIKVYQPNQ